MAKKSREEVGVQEELKERHIIRRKLWTSYLREINKATTLYQNVRPSRDHWISAGSGISGVIYSSVVTGDYIRIELTISGRTQEENKSIFDELYTKKEQIENEFGSPLARERMDDKRMSRVKYELPDVSILAEEDWEKMVDFMKINVPKFEKAFKTPIQQLTRR